MGQQYATIEDLNRYGLPATATAGLYDDDLNAALLAASEEADGYLQAQFDLPLLTWTSSLRRHVCSMAAWTILSGRRGFNPQGSDSVYQTRHEQAIAWLEGVARGVIPVPPGMTDGTAENDGAPRVSTGTAGLTSRGGAVSYALGGRGW
jgi:phage gp36-like protein